MILSDSNFIAQGTTGTNDQASKKCRDAAETGRTPRAHG